VRVASAIAAPGAIVRHYVESRVVRFCAAVPQTAGAFLALVVVRGAVPENCGAGCRARPLCRPIATGIWKVLLCNDLKKTPHAN
jgi:hypothetical protein